MAGVRINGCDSLGENNSKVCTLRCFDDVHADGGVAHNVRIGHHCDRHSREIELRESVGCGLFIFTPPTTTSRDVTQPNGAFE